MARDLGESDQIENMSLATVRVRWLSRPNRFSKPPENPTDIALLGLPARDTSLAATVSTRQADNPRSSERPS
jgi:hypothetical protein